ncbi:glutamine-hydrolyzing carbamoyl-phosphate synthase small subunit [Enterobacteriaceae endosymbiont of Macroplea appendiculata]|uniref:glutamine-hydrolyzing carbamoyl-phosphate synthase small subunit n=1 Tax=Enterobacteriaceae endosymbiont of Macroplea appendiculata TaxID=2675790 RepID=UPI001449E027|nr:glutamine-hydrolyzing carbamoyl-phosphate synthase small subunit [Enterobacteriaceae endosymbiont of Macroplea appendiculata]QJC31035.1 glutamine-hydrolyzing carbamoyl-phosphate synthase small subunit [Enterobacteriaceae endosymbiont of Macroplea appendiculata]
MEDGTEFFGQSIGIDGMVTGEFVFNTSITGYQEIITDPSYYKQIVVLTYPHIGNVGISLHDNESSKIFLQGLVIQNISMITSNYRSYTTLDIFLKKHNIITITNIDTRQLTRLLRNKKNHYGCIITGNNNYKKEDILDNIHIFKKKYIKKNLVQHVTTKINYSWIHSNIDRNVIELHKKRYNYSVMHVIAYDFGIKNNILNMLVDRGCYVTIVTANTSFNEIMALNPDGIFLSNGPGDPRPCTSIINTIKQILTTNIPIFGICLGHQLLALANNAKIKKMFVGHHGSNHPVKNLLNNKIFITTQNHGFTIDKKNIPKNLYITHISLFDRTIQGIHHRYKPAFGFQGHPEGNPGPHDIAILFDYFIQLIQQYCSIKIKESI